MGRSQYTWSSFLIKLTKLKRGGTKYGLAPHKPILLLAVLDLIEKGEIQKNRIPITPELLGAFRDTWSLLVETANRPEIQLPLYHLQNDGGFWELIDYRNQKVEKYISSFNTLTKRVAFGRFDPGVFQFFTKPQERTLLVKHLLDTYFPGKADHYFSQRKSYNFLQEVEADILGERQLIYPPKEEDEITFLRGPQFKKVVPRIYNYTCAFTGMRVDALNSVSMVDACHIVPISKSGDDTIKNGIALCPNMHRAFDRGLIGVDETYRLIVSQHFVEDESNSYSLRALKGKEILMPFGAKYQPGSEKFLWHRTHIFQG